MIDNFYLHTKQSACCKLVHFSMATTSHGSMAVNPDY